jgi:hypothetical protein
MWMEPALTLEAPGHTASDPTVHTRLSSGLRPVREVFEGLAFESSEPTVHTRLSSKSEEHLVAARLRGGRRRSAAPGWRWPPPPPPAGHAAAPSAPCRRGPVAAQEKAAQTDGWQAVGGLRLRAGRCCSGGEACVAVECLAPYNRLDMVLVYMVLYLHVFMDEF